MLDNNLAQGGNVKPVWCTECGWASIPVGATGATQGTDYGIYGSKSAIPSDIDVAWRTTGALWYLQHGFARVYTFQLMDGSGGFCTYGLIQRSGTCGPYSSGVSYAPKGSYNSLTDLIGIMADQHCKAPGCTFKPASLTWGWTATPAPNHNPVPTPAPGTNYGGDKYLGTDPHQIHSAQYEDSQANVYIAYWYGATDYFQSNTSSSCYSTTSCYSWCGDITTVTNQQAAGTNNRSDCWDTTLYISNAHLWPSCINIDTDLAYNDDANPGSFGHMIPTARNLTFSNNDLISLHLRPELQILKCTTNLPAPATTGTPVPFPTMIPSPWPAAVGAPDPTPTAWGTPTMVPTAFMTKPPSM